MNPHNTKAYLKCGRIYHTFGDYEKAISYYSKAIDIKPNDARFYLERGKVYYDYLYKDDKVLKDFNKAIELRPDYPSALFERGYYYYDMLDDYEKAIKDFDKFIDLVPNSAKAYFHRGVVYEMLDDWERAINDLIKAIELDPNSKEYLLEFECACESLNEYKRTIQIEQNEHETDVVIAESGDKSATSLERRESKRIVLIGKGILEILTSPSLWGAFILFLIFFGVWKRGIWIKIAFWVVSIAMGLAIVSLIIDFIRSLFGGRSDSGFPDYWGDDEGGDDY